MYTPLSSVFKIASLEVPELGALFGAGTLFLLAALAYLRLTAKKRAPRPAGAG
jgi:hypothetical protein